MISSANPTGGGNAIAIVDAFDDPYAVSDLQHFSSQFGLPKTNIEVVYATGTDPGLDSTGGWELEEALDIEWAHAMAPKAKIYLVEALTSSYADSLEAEVVASNLVAAAGGGEVSNSWGGTEFSDEISLDSTFTTPRVVYFAAVGDTEGTIWPSASPNVVAPGGTSISRNPLTGYFQGEYAWNSSGGGPSSFEVRPSYQNGVQSMVGFTRGVPDVSADADPNSGVCVWETNSVTGGGWYAIGGTSLASPVWAGIVNFAGNFASSSQAELNALENCAIENLPKETRVEPDHKEEPRLKPRGGWNIGIHRGKASDMQPLLKRDQKWACVFRETCPRKMPGPAPKRSSP